MGTAQLMALWIASQFKPRRGWRTGRYYHLWASAVRERWDHRCAITGRRDGLVCHHLDGASEMYTRRYMPRNGILIHHDIHREFHVNWMGGYGVPCTNDDFILFCKSRQYKIRRVGGKNGKQKQ